jgi:hypothetical protein
MTTTATITKTDTSKFEAALAACDAHNEPGVLASLYEAARAKARPLWRAFPRAV